MQDGPIPKTEVNALKSRDFIFAFGAALMAAACATSTGDPVHSHHQQATPAMAAPPSHPMPDDARTFVQYPDALRIHTLANMRDHLLTMAQIQEQLAKGSFDKASELAEQRLGMSSLELHGAHEVAMHMPKGMQDAGTAMHRSASQFAILAKDASVTGDMKAPLLALARVSQSCVACHAAYRIQ